MEDRGRRRLLEVGAAGLVAGVAGLAGCVGIFGGGSRGETDGTGTDDGDGPTAGGTARETTGGEPRR